MSVLLYIFCLFSSFAPFGLHSPIASSCWTWSGTLKSRFAWNGSGWGLGSVPWVYTLHFFSPHVARAGHGWCSYGCLFRRSFIVHSALQTWYGAITDYIGLSRCLFVLGFLLHGGRLVPDTYLTYISFRGFFFMAHG